MAVRLRSADLAEAVRAVVLVEIAFECMIETGQFILVGVDELGVMVGDDPGGLGPVRTNPF